MIHIWLAVIAMAICYYVGFISGRDIERSKNKRVDEQ